MIEIIRSPKVRRYSSVVRRNATMNRFSIVAAAVLSLLAAELPVGRTKAQDASDVER
jgi:hypothetical protein